MADEEFKIEETGVAFPEKDWETKIDESVDKKIKNYLLMGAWVLISVILGYLIATIWDLNGKIYEVAGKQTIQYETINELRLKKDYLEKENVKLKEKLINLKLQHPNVKEAK